MNQAVNCLLAPAGRDVSLVDVSDGSKRRVVSAGGSDASSDDLFPGSGAIGRAWARYTDQPAVTIVRNDGSARIAEVCQ
jgi:hypothetical protein